MSYPGSFVKYIVTGNCVLKVFNPIVPNTLAQAILIGHKIWANKMIKDNETLDAILSEKFEIKITSRNSFEIII